MREKGKGGGLVLDKAYADVKEAPADTEFKGDELKEGKLTLAIPTGATMAGTPMICLPIPLCRLKGEPS